MQIVGSMVRSFSPASYSSYGRVIGPTHNLHSSLSEKFNALLCMNFMA